MDKVDKQLIKKLNELPEDYWDFKDADVRAFTHEILNYPVTFSPKTGPDFKLV